MKLQTLAQVIRTAFPLTCMQCLSVIIHFIYKHFNIDWWKMEGNMMVLKVF